MRVDELVKALDLKVFCLPHPELEVTGGYAGDLLSWVMGRAREGDVWLTIMSNQNVAAVAVMADTACVVLTEDVEPDEALLRRAEQQEIDLLGTGLSTFAAAAAVKELLG